MTSPRPQKNSEKMHEAPTSDDDLICPETAPVTAKWRFWINSQLETQLSLSRRVFLRKSPPWSCLHVISIIALAELPPRKKTCVFSARCFFRESGFREDSSFSFSHPRAAHQIMKSKIFTKVIFFVVKAPTERKNLHWLFSRFLSPRKKTCRGVWFLAVARGKKNSCFLFCANRQYAKPREPLSAKSLCRALKSESISYQSVRKKKQV